MVARAPAAGMRAVVNGSMGLGSPCRALLHGRHSFNAATPRRRLSLPTGCFTGTS